MLDAARLPACRPYIGELDEGLSGSASVKDIETMFQMIYMTFTEPRADQDVFKLDEVADEDDAGQHASHAGFRLRGGAERGADAEPSARADADAGDDRQAWTWTRSLAFYKDRFADASDFTFVFVGTLDPAALKPLVEKYLGSLPSTGRKETWKDHNVRPPGDRRGAAGGEGPRAPEPHARRLHRPV